MSLILHILTHLLLSLLAGFLAWKIWKNFRASFSGAILSGFLVDLDHLIDYFLAFGFSFRPDYFFSGKQFLYSDRLYILFHGWELVLIFLFMVFFFRSKVLKSFLLAFSLSLFFHLVFDVFTNNIPAKTYSLLFRAKNNFEMERLVYPEHWQEHLEKKRGFKN